MFHWRKAGTALLLMALAALAALAAVLLDAVPAFAHVTLHPSSVVAGSSDVEISFRVPNERDDANTVELQVYFPTDLPLLTVDVLPVPGWTATVQTQNLSKPVNTDDGPVSQIVSSVTWKATAGGIPPGDYEDFDVSAGAVSDHTGQLVFKALQTYSSGEIVRWIEVPVAGQPEPATPAPILTLTSPAGPTATVSPPRAQRATTSSGSSDALAIAALVIGVVDLAALAGLGLVVLRGRRQDTGTRAST